MEHRLLAVYLNDHYAGSVAGLELARRAEGENRGEELGAFLAGLAREIEEDRGVLLAVMGALAVRPSPVKPKVAWALEKVGRLKLNGRLVHYSPLSRLVELEGLLLGVTGKRALWISLAELAPHEPRLREFDFEALTARAEAQLEEIEKHRRHALAGLAAA